MCRSEIRVQRERLGEVFSGTLVLVDSDVVAADDVPREGGARGGVYQPVPQGVQLLKLVLLSAACSVQRDGFVVVRVGIQDAGCDLVAGVHVLLLKEFLCTPTHDICVSGELGVKLLPYCVLEEGQVRGTTVLQFLNIQVPSGKRLDQSQTEKNSKRTNWSTQRTHTHTHAHTHTHTCINATVVIMNNTESKHL